MSSPISQSARITGMNLNSRSPLTRWGIVLGLALGYMLVYPPLEHAIGPSASTLMIIPVAAATWYFGLIAGLFASLLAIFYSIAFLIFVEKHNLEALFYFGLAPRLLMLIIMVLLVQVVHNRLEEFMRIAAESRWRERYLTLLRITTNSILDPKNAEDRYYYLITHMANLFVADYGYFLRWDEIQEQAVLIASTLPLERPVDKIVLKPGESAMGESILRTERGLAIDNALNSQDPFHATLFKDLALPIHSILALPLIVKQHKLGIVILAYENPRHFTTDEVDHAGKGGEQIALVLQNVQRGADIQKRLRESNALANISLALSETEKIGLSNVLQLIVNSAKELIPNTERAIIHLLDSERQELTPEAVIGYDNPVEGKRKKMRLGEGIAGQVIASGETINIADIETDTRFVKLGAPPKFRSLMVSPVHSGEQKLGTISILSNTPNAFSQEESRLLSALGIQAAIAIENANLLESIQQSLKESNALYRINQGLASSLKSDELLKDTVDLLQKSFGYYHVQVYVAEPATGNFIARAGSGKIGDQLKEERHHLSPGEGIVGYAAETGTPFFTNNVDQVVFFTRNPLLPDTRSELAVPVKVGERILGVLDVQQIPPIDLTQRDIQLVNAVADQLAIALQNANLYEELQTSLEHEKAIRNQLVQN
jgi:GAF domain-containing protein